MGNGFMAAFTEVFTTLSNFVWGPPMLVLLVGTGIYLTIILKGLQFRTLLPSLHLALIKRRDKGSAGDVSQFGALVTALAATIGTGNIVGVTTAVAAGGPGACCGCGSPGSSVSRRNTPKRSSR